MKNIMITLDDVVRAKTLQIGRIYKKFVKREIELESLEFNNTDFAEIFGFDTVDEYEQFLYYNYPFEIFASAPMVDTMVDKVLNNWTMTVNNDYEKEDDGYLNIMLGNAFEFNASIGNTYFFLSKMATRIREVYLPMNSSTVWDKADIVVTATPEILDSKPEGKIAIKINMDYNKDCKADYEYHSLNDFIKDSEIIEKIRNRK